jgi:hypothetical protein
MITVWTMPIPSTNAEREPYISKTGYRDYELKFFLVDDDDQECTFSISFKGVESYKCTYLTSCSVELITTAYDKLVDCGKTDWLVEVEEISERVSRLKKDLHHYRIFFDDGPCFEFICEGVTICPLKK